MRFIHEPLARILRATSIPRYDFNKLIGWLVDLRAITHLASVTVRRLDSAYYQNELSFEYFFFHFIGRELTTWPANNCLQKSDLLQIIFCSCVIETTLLSENGGSVPRADREWFDIFSWSKERWSSDKTITELGYRKISWFVSLRLRQIFHLLATHKSRYFLLNLAQWLLIDLSSD